MNLASAGRPSMPLYGSGMSAMSKTISVLILLGPNSPKSKLTVGQQMNELLDYCHGLQEGARAVVKYLHPKDQCHSDPDRLVKELSRAPAYAKAWK